MNNHLLLSHCVLERMCYHCGGVATCHPVFKFKNQKDGNKNKIQFQLPLCSKCAGLPRETYVNDLIIAILVERGKKAKLVIPDFGEGGKNVILSFEPIRDGAHG